MEGDKCGLYRFFLHACNAEVTTPALQTAPFPPRGGAPVRAFFSARTDPARKFFSRPGIIAGVEFFQQRGGAQVPAPG